MGVFDRVHDDNYEQIIYCNDTKTGLKAIIAMHSTALGPAVGGCRMWNYASEEEALTDVLRLSKGMTYKAAISQLAWGGGKSIIMGDGKTPELLRRFGDFVETLAGHYITAKDVGIDSNDLKTIKTRTKHILGIAGETNSSGDPSPATAWGVYNGMLACAEKAFGAKSLKGLHVAVQGLGAVNFHLLKYLAQEGARVTACDIAKPAVERAQAEYGVSVVGPDAILDVPCDIFSPGALGAVINDHSISRLKCKVVAGAANNQLATERHGETLLQRGILYAPDYAINAGGLINIYHEPKGYDRDRAFAQVATIYDTVKLILDRSEAEKRPTNRVANAIAEERVKAAERAKGR
ncbi:MAG: Glu/Leu/Phe/Val dehydrogenase [Bdellovibrionales bacterium]|nr:Glu/Leu/Phe/Val dehydrogenase [Bdellovibrionales bacterium]